MVGLMIKTECRACQKNSEAISEVGSSLSGFAEWEWIIGSIKALVISDECREPLKGMLENITGAIYITDPEGNLELISRGGLEITGYEPEELIGQPITTLFESGKFQELCTGGNKVQITDSALFRHEAEIIRKDGGNVSLWLSMFALAKGEDIKAWLVVAEDAEKYSKQEAQIRRSQRLESLGQLMAGVAHELNSPMQYVGDNVQFLQKAFHDLSELIALEKNLLQKDQAENLFSDLTAKIEDTMAKIDLEFLLQEIPSAIRQTLEGIGHVSEIMKAMKAFVHPGWEEKVPANVCEIIDDVLAMTRNEWKYVADIQKEYNLYLPLISCIPGDLRQAVLNIIMNAVHAIADVVGDGPKIKGKITIGVGLVNNWVEIRISDTGTGIPAEIRPRIFEPFFTTKKIGRGTGQGLPIVHSIITDKHGGTIHYETEMGKGTTFILRLPVVSVIDNEGNRQ